MADGGRIETSLPEGAAAENQSNEAGAEIQLEGSATVSQLWKEERWTNRLSKEERKQTCSRCKEVGHNCLHCPYPIQYIRVPGDANNPDCFKAVVLILYPGKRRCSRCGRRGHNRQTCHGPLIPAVHN